MDLCLMAVMQWNEILNLLWMIGSVAAGLGLVIFVHELGHFLVAKMCGVKCEKFYIGFDVPMRIGPIRLPSRLGRFQWGETEYGIGIIPLGGYVKMLGQDDDPRNTQAEAERIRVRKAEGEGGGESAAAAAAAGPASFPAADAAPAAPAAGKQEEFELDPRSFPAKTVPQRMAIISAGVIMNMIFAVIFATFAFRGGVSYSPCEIGSTVPGSPAWLAGLQPGDRIVKLGVKGIFSRHLRFDWDLRNAVHMAGGQEDVHMVIQQRDGEQLALDIRPVVHLDDGDEYPMIGITPATEVTLATQKPAVDYFPAGKAEPAFQGGDKIVAIAGSGGRHSVRDGYELRKILSQLQDQPIKVTVERTSKQGEQTSKETVDVAVGTNRIQRFGVVLTRGAVSGIRPGSPAAQAGFQVGDLIERVGGEAVGDPLTLPNRVLASVGSPLEIQVKRRGGDGRHELVTLTATPEWPDSYENDYAVGSPGAIRSLGIVFPMIPTVAAIEAKSPAEQAGLQPGDRIVAVQFLSTDAKKKAAELFFKGEETPLDATTMTWPYIYSLVQVAEPGTQLKLIYQRSGQRKSVTLAPQASDEFYAERGLVFRSKSEIHKAESWGQAVALGFRRTKEDASRVGLFLQKLVTGRISPKKLGGPLSIATVAGMEASESVTRLLLFLTLLSANLAILNFLPIPALDGGHMMFLLAEWVRGKPVDERVQFALTLAGVACLLGLMIFVSGLDIRRIFFR